MFTEHGMIAVAKFILIILLANGLAIVLHWWLGWENVKPYVYCVFLLVYLVNFEELALEKRRRDKIHKVTDL